MKNKKTIIFAILIFILLFLLYIYINSKSHKKGILFTDMSSLMMGKEYTLTFIVKEQLDEKDIYFFVNNELKNDITDFRLREDGTISFHYTFIPQEKEYTFTLKNQRKTVDEVEILCFPQITEKEYENSFEYISEINEKTGIQSIIDYIEKLKNRGVVLRYYIEKNSVVAQLSTGIWYIYTEPIEGTEQGSKEIGVITCQPYQIKGELETSVFDNIAENLEDNFDNIKCVGNYDNEEINLGVIEQFSKNQIILWNGHGEYLEEFGSFLFTKENYEELMSKLLPGEEIEGALMISGFQNGEVMIAINHKYITNHMNNISDSFVYLGACKSMQDDRLANAFMEKGAAGVVGFDNTVQAIYDRKFAEGIFSYLTKLNQKSGKYFTLKEAFEKTNDVLGINEFSYIDSVESDNVVKTITTSARLLGGEDYRICEITLDDLPITDAIDNSEEMEEELLRDLPDGKYVTIHVKQDTDKEYLREIAIPKNHGTEYKDGKIRISGDIAVYYEETDSWETPLESKEYELPVADNCDSYVQLEDATVPVDMELLNDMPEGYGFVFTVTDGVVNELRHFGQ